MALQKWAGTERTCQNRSKTKVIPVVFFDYYEFLPGGQTVNEKYYLAISKRLRKAIRLKQTDLWTDNSSIFHHGNVPSHSSMIVTDFLAKHETPYIPNTPSRQIWLPVTFLFSKLINPLRGTRDEVLSNSLKVLKDIHVCIGSKEVYFEGDNKDLYKNTQKCNFFNLSGSYLFRWIRNTMQVFYPIFS